MLGDPLRTAVTAYIGSQWAYSIFKSNDHFSHSCLCNTFVGFWLLCNKQEPLFTGSFACSSGAKLAVRCHDGSSFWQLPKSLDIWCFQTLCSLECKGFWQATFTQYPRYSVSNFTHMLICCRLGTFVVRHVWKSLLEFVFHENGAPVSSQDSAFTAFLPLDEHARWPIIHLQTRILSWRFAHFFYGCTHFFTSLCKSR